jgi:hypothetical protein
MPETCFSITVDIAAPPSRVWTVMSDFERWPEWTPSVKKVKRLFAGPIKLGGRVIIWQPKVPPAVWKLTALNPGRGFTWRTGSPLVWAVASHAIEETAQGSRVTLAVQYGGLFGGLLARITRDMNHRYLSYEAAGLKRRSEDGVAPH